MQRVGKKFELGYPHTAGSGLCYFWPNKSYKELFNSKRKELSPFLLEKTKEYIKKFKVYSDIQYIQEGKWITIHMGGNGKSIEIGNFDFSGGGNSHNLDGYADRFTAFNITSDTIEFLDPEIKAPRILLENEKFILNYPLPENYKLIPAEKYPHLLKKEFLQKRFFDPGKLGNITDIVNKEYQEIKSDEGRIHIEDGLCQGLDFHGFDAMRATFVISVLLNACE